MTDEEYRQMRMAESGEDIAYKREMTEPEDMQNEHFYPDEEPVSADAKSNLAWMTMFYALPRELVQKRPAYLELPRNISQLLASEKHMKLVKEDAFLELVWDCYAWGIWQAIKVPDGKGGYKEIPGDWQHYSGDFPLWRLSYDIIRYFRMSYETEMEWSFQRLFTMPLNVTRGKNDGALLQTLSGG